MKARIRLKAGLANEYLPQEPIAKLGGHDGPISAASFTHDGKYVVTGSWDRTVRLSNPLRLDPAHPPPKVSTNHDDDVRLQDLPEALPIQVYSDGITHPISAVAVDDQSTTLVAASEKTLVVLDCVTSQCKRRLQGHVGRINAVGVNQGSEVYLTASYDASVRLWDGRSRSHEPIQILKEAKDSVTCVHSVQSEYMTIIRTASIDGIVRTYDLRMGMLQCDDVHSPITGMCATSDQRCLAVNCLDGALRFLDLEKGALLRHYADGHKAGQYGLNCALSAGDTYIVTGSEDGSVVFYDISKGRVCQVLEGQRQPTCSVTVNPQADFASVVVSASFDGTAIVWGHDTSLMQW
eukprot:scaffold3821_cov173-Amphora_coffeaeformis.AAC.22